jgi:hypothetical protein
MEPKIPESVREGETAILRRQLAQVTRQLDEALARLKVAEGGDVDTPTMSARVAPAPTDPTAPPTPHSTIYTPTP